MHGKPHCHRCGNGLYERIVKLNGAFGAAHHINRVRNAGVCIAYHGGYRRALNVYGRYVHKYKHLVLPNVIQFFYARWMGKGDSFQLELENSMDTGIKEIGLLLEQEETEAA